MTRNEAKLEAVKNISGNAGLAWSHGFDAGWDAISAEREAICRWQYDADDETWDTACDHRFQTVVGTPSENDMAYCCYCGRKLVEAA